MSTPLEKFPPSNGTVTGSLGVAMAAVVAVVSVVTSPTVGGVRIFLGAALVGLLIWMVVLRPRAALFEDTLLLRQELGDTRVPLTLIDTVQVGRDLTVTVEDRRYHCTGISRSRRTVQGAEPSTYVENRIREGIADAHRLEGPDVELRVQRRLAVPELSVLGVLAVALVVSMLM